MQNTILIIEDNEGLTKLLTRIMQGKGYKTVCVSNGLEALSWLKEHTPFLAILDYSLPDMNGIEFIEGLCKQTSNLPPFIVSTGQGDERIAVKMMKLGARDYIVKDNNFLEMLPHVVDKIAKVINNENKFLLLEASLKESNQLNSQIISSVQEGVIVYDTNLRYKVWNPFMEELTGMPAADVLGKYALDVLPFLEETGAYNNLKKALKGEFTPELDIQFQIHSTQKSGWVSDSMGPMFDTDGKVVGVFSTVRDIADRKLAEEALRKSEAIQSKMVANIGDVITIIDKDSINRYKSPNIEKWFGWKPEERINQNTLNIVHPDDLENAQDFFNSLAQKHDNTGILEFRYKCKDGNYKWIQFTGVNLFNDKDINGILGNYHDISDRKASEHELLKIKERVEESEAKFKSAYYTSPDAVNINTLAGEYIETNEGFTRLTGYTREDVIGINSSEIDIWTRPEDRDLLVKTLKEQGKIENLESVFKCKDGSLKTALMSASIIHILNEPHILSVTRDITKRKKVENDLIKAREKAEESNNLKTAFLQNMSHEIRTPMNAISGFTSMLNKPNLSEGKRNSFISIIQSSSDQLLSIVTNILTLSSIETKQEKINIEKVCINDILIELLSIFKPQALNQNVSLYAKQKLSDSQAEIYTDKTKVTQILINLLTNALKFTNEGSIEFGYNLKSVVVAHAETEPEGSEQRLHCGVEVSRSAQMEIYVKDTGIGIKKEYQKNIFERFNQAEISIGKAYGGTGLGLSISQGFVELLGGEIWVESEINKGATFYFTLPYKQVNKTEATNTDLKTIENRKTFLVAEDEEYNFLLIEELLIEQHVELIHAKNGKEAVDICMANANINLILMDIKMPVMDGYTAAKMIKKIRPDLPIIAQTAYALEYEIEVYNDVFDDYLPKPIEAELLIKRVEKYFGK
ncbi:MAG: PAS domain S-box protein [Salinivirgaceae bacterium]|nr:PAS domain S-box protein [Salinivirgaceae bacterium]